MTSEGVASSGIGASRPGESRDGSPWKNDSVGDAGGDRGGRDGGAGGEDGGRRGFAGLKARGFAGERAAGVSQWGTWARAACWPMRVAAAPVSRARRWAASPGRCQGWAGAISRETAAAEVKW